jgi:hypothetical protein
MSIAAPLSWATRGLVARPGPGVRRADDARGGYVAIDALVALSILSTAVMLTLGLVANTRRVASAAWEHRRAEVILRGLLDTSPRELGTWSGQVEAFDWSLTSSAVDGYAVQPFVLPCRRAIALRARESRRRYALEIVEICQRPAQP